VIESENRCRKEFSRSEFAIAPGRQSANEHERTYSAVQVYSFEALSGSAAPFSTLSCQSARSFLFEPLVM
jgi:hypothetical protein